MGLLTYQKTPAKAEAAIWGKAGGISAEELTGLPKIQEPKTQIRVSPVQIKAKERIFMAILTQNTRKSLPPNSELADSKGRKTQIWDFLQREESSGFHFLF
ncbi:hypothetical protein SLA2020_124030 [Shorea laevis]